jgi:methionine-gamma-lyase
MTKKFQTNLIHSGDGQFQKKLNKSASVAETLPIYLTSVFAFDDIAAVDSVYEKKSEGYIYSRIASPNTDATSEILAQADEGDNALVFASGMAAITMTILSFVKSGDHIISSPVLYGGVNDFFVNELKRFNIEVSFVDFLKDDITKHIKPNTKLIYTETISNPLVEVADIAAISKIAKAANLLFIIDNTFATSAVVKPLKLGADIVVYSATKYLGGHSDIVAGAVVSSTELISKIKRFQVLYGATLGAMDAWLLARSLRTLDLRIAKHCSNALKVANFLEQHKSVEKVYYPGLKSSPSFELAKAQFEKDRFGAMLSVNLKGTRKEAEDFVRKLKNIPFVPSLAGTATTVSYSVSASHRFYKEEERVKLGITQNQVRISVGLEDADDIIAELSEGLS